MDGVDQVPLEKDRRLELSWGLQGCLLIAQLPAQKWVEDRQSRDYSGGRAGGQEEWGSAGRKPLRSRWLGT